MRHLLLFIFLLVIETGQGQDFQYNYQPLRPGKVPKVVLKDIFTANEKIAAARPIDDSRVKKDFIKLIKDSHNDFAQLDTNRLLMYNDSLTQYINAIVQKITTANPELVNRNIQVFSVRDEEVNAFNQGPAIVAFNLGLLARAASYEEFVFVVCHELSHEYLDHVYYSAEDIARTINDKTLKKKVRQLKRQEYNSVKQYELLMAKTIAGIRRHNRSQELQADSMGLVFYTRLNLDKKYPIALMQMFDSSEVPYAHQKINYKDYFDKDKAFFDDSWLTVDTTRFYWKPDSSVWMMPDSLKTHPDSKIRLSQLKTLCGTIEEKPSATNAQFMYMRNMARFELMEEFLNNEDYANALYYGMQMQQQFTQNIYVKNVVLNSLIEMSNALKEHRFSQVVDHPNYFYYPGFNTLLYFLHNLNSSSLRKMAVTYFKNNLQEVKGDAFTGYNALLMKSWETTKEKQPGLITVYKDNFQDSFYLNKLESKFKPKKK